MAEVGDFIDGKYRLTRCLGEGGMGTVFEAVHEGIGKGVALKFLRPEHITDQKAVTRFHREAQTAAAAGHHGIVDIHDMGVADDGSPYLVMELLHGQSLGAMLEHGGALDVSTSAYVVCYVLSALSAAHNAGIVHRDLKPDNIFLIDTGAAVFDVKLLDFGISRVTSPNAGFDQSLRLTRTGMVVGTPLYMSPEQAKGKSDLDHRIDIYATGVILYECLTGKLPFEATNYNELIAKVITESPLEPTVVRPDLPPSLENVVLRALAKERDERYQTAAEMFEALMPFVDERSLIKIPLPSGLTFQPRQKDAAQESVPETGAPRRKVIVPIIAAAVVGLIVVGLAGAYLLSLLVCDETGFPGSETNTGAAGEVALNGVDADPVDRGHQQAMADAARGEGSADASLEASVRPAEITGRRWIEVRPGRFMMGSPPTEMGRGGDERPHQVVLTGAFLMSPTETTRQEFRDVMGYSPSQLESCGADCPVENVSWHEAAAFSNGLSSKAGLELCYACSGTGSDRSCSLAPRHATPYQCKGYRLPTEAEWEYAARAGTKTATYRGNVGLELLACEQPHAILDPIAWFCGNSGNRIHRVGTKEPNQWGLFDMLGNVLEWCHDRYDDYPTGGIIDPWGGASGSTRVFRGGSCHHYANLARAASRGQSTPDDHSQWLGVRLVRSVD